MDTEKNTTAENTAALENETLFETLSFLAKRRDVAYQKGSAGLEKVKEVDEVEKYLRKMIPGQQGNGIKELFPDTGDPLLQENSGGGTDHGTATNGPQQTTFIEGGGEKPDDPHSKLLER